jgi:hypothetical protein
MRCRARSTTTIVPVPARPMTRRITSASCAMSNISSPSPRTSRSRPGMWTRRSPMWPDRSSWCRSPMPAGAAFTTRSTAPTRSRRTTARPAAADTTRLAARRWWRAREFLDQAAPLAEGSHKDAVAYAIDGGTVWVHPEHAILQMLSRSLAKLTSVAAWSGQGTIHPRVPKTPRDSSRPRGLPQALRSASDRLGR